MKFSASSVICFLVDNLLFFILDLIFKDMNLDRWAYILLSYCPARFVSASLNYVFNSKFVFHSHSGLIASFTRYWMLVVIVLSLSYANTSLLSSLFDLQDGWVILFVKIGVDLAISIISYKAQRRWVFSSKKAVSANG